MLTFEKKSIFSRLALYLRNMRLRLSKRFYAALMAAIASVTFTFSVQQAAAAEQMDASASSETETAMAVEASGDKEASEAEESEEIEEEEENREPDSAPEVSVGFNGIIGSSDAFDFLGDIENVGNLDNASQQQAGAQSVSSSASLPSDDLGFTANACAGSIAEALVDVAPPSVPAAIASELKLTTPAKSTSSGSSSSSSDDYSSVADASTVSGSAWNASYGSHISAPAFRSLSSKAPSNFAAANATGSSLVIDTPAGDSVPLLGATEPPAVWIFSFNDGKETHYVENPRSVYDLRVAEGYTEGVITFNPDYSTTLPVQGAFVMTGEKFTIDTNGVNISFAQPLSNYGTSVTVIGNGSIETQGAAAFKSITVGSDAGGDTPIFKIGSQIGVTDNFQVKAGGVLEVGETGHLLLTQKIETEEGSTITLKPGAVIDASNLSHEAATDMQIKFLSFEKTAGGYTTSTEKGFGFLYGAEGLTWNIATTEGTVIVEQGEEGTNGPKLFVGDLSFDIEDGGVVVHEQTDYTVWFQNGGSSPALNDIILFAQSYPPEEQRSSEMSIMANAGETSTVSILVDGQVSEQNVLYVTRGATATLTMEAEGDVPSIGQMKVSDMATLNISNAANVKQATFIGQRIKVNTFGGEEWEPNQFTPMNLLVESASEVTIMADILPYMGRFKGDNFDIYMTKLEYPWINAGQVSFDVGSYNLKGSLILSNESTFDLRKTYSGHYSATLVDRTEQKVTDLTFEEEFVGLTMSGYGAITLDEGSAFLASTFNDDAKLTADGMNVDTSLKKDGETTYKKTVDEYGIPHYEFEETPESLAGYEVNGAVEITSPTGLATITTVNGLDAGNYTIRNKGFKVSNATITVNDKINDYEDYEGDEKNTTISNVLTGDSVINEKANHGTVTLDNKDSNDYVKLWAQEGDIAIANREAANAETVQIGAGRMVSVKNLDQATKLNVSSLLLAEGSEGSYSKIDAELHLSPSATLNVAAADGVGGIDMMGNEVVFDIDYGETALTLSPGDYSQAWAMEKGGKYDLFHNVSAFTMYEGVWPIDYPMTEDTWADDASVFFSNLEKGCFLLCYSGTGEVGGNGGNVGTIYLYSMVPEPTTGTLSLLALAALAARRRRKG